MQPTPQQIIAAIQQGQLTEAEALCHAILATAPADFSALYLLGMIMGERGDPVAALDLFRRATASDPNRAEGHVACGDALRAMRRPADALPSYERASALMPGHLPLLVTRGNLLRQLRRPEEALACFEQALSAQPDHPALLGSRGIVLAELGRLDQALAALDRVVQLLPNDPDTRVNRASVLTKLSRWPDALADYDLAVAARPDHAATRAIRAGALLKMNRPAEALADADHALMIRRDDPEALTHRAFALLDLHRPEEALAAFDRALALRPNHPAAIADRGNALIDLGRPEEALAAYDTAVRLDPANAHVIDHRGNALRVLGRPHDALEDYKRAVLIAPDDPTVQGHLSLCHLLLGQFEEGLPLYECRWNLPAIRPLPGRHRQPLWLGQESLHGKTILLQAEQGLGDMIQFCRYAPLVAALGATVWLTVPPAMRRLLTGLDGVERLFVSDDVPPPYDFRCPLMSLPLALGTRLDTIPAPARYIMAEPALVDAWTAAIPVTGRKRVGLVWSGNAAHSNDLRRSIQLARLARAMVPSADYFGLQTELREADRAVLEARGDIAMPVDTTRDFAETAALIETLDLVIAVDTSVAHLAGAMGKPVWILLPHDPDWRWMLGREDSPWYPSARLFRQPVPGDWDSVIDRVAAALGGFCLLA